ncbi:MAG TPA: hypothetical protein VLM91_19385 [Candidatus Methylomirabilis sp.]|nr:hypothetical protein [Candidatus Methylomirabilis sp.]
MERHPVLLHLDEGNGGHVSPVLASVENLLADFGEGKIEVELVVNAEDILAFLKTPDLRGAHVERLRAKGLASVCASSRSG